MTLCKESILDCGRRRRTTRSLHQLDPRTIKPSPFQTLGTRELAAGVEFPRERRFVVTIVRGDGEHRRHLLRALAVRNVRGLRAGIADAHQGPSPGGPGTLPTGRQPLVADIDFPLTYCIIQFQVAEVLQMIFESPGGYPSLDSVVLSDLFRNIDLREMRGSCVPVRLITRLSSSPIE